MKAALVLIAIGIVGLLLLVLLSARSEPDMPEHFPALNTAALEPDPAPPGDTETATLGSGCFWCTEAVFQQMKGVLKVESGYSGGHVRNPSYEAVCSGRTGHAEVVQVTFDPKVVSFAELLEVFWRSHDPTTLNRQGNDTGTQYRSAVFYHNERQKKLAEMYKQQINEAAVFRNPLVTEISPFTEFFPATEDHQNFYANNPRQGYCRVVIGPKVEKLRKVFAGKLKDQ